MSWHDKITAMSASDKKHYIDPAWPKGLAEGDHAVTELLATHAGATSPYGETQFPLAKVDYVHPHTVINT